MPDGIQEQTDVERVATIDLKEQFKASNGTGHHQPVTLTESDRLVFARQILLWLVVVALFAFGAFILAPDNKGAAQVFELIKVGVLPLVTLVIGFYFPNTKK